MKPNIIVMVPHDLGWHDVGCFGNPANPTPAIDSLARDGAKFERAYVTAPQCSPSRASVVSGRYPHTTGMMGLSNKPDWFSLDPSERTLPEFLKANGFRTAQFGAWHVDHIPEQRGFDEMYPRLGNFRFDRKDEAEKHERFLSVLSALVNRDAEEPFFAYVCPFSTHRPFPLEMDPTFGPDKVWVPPHLSDNELTRKDLAEYYTLLRWLDKGVADILDVLDQAGAASNTLIIFLSDHGAAFPGAKCTLYDTGVRTPLLVRWPDKVKPGTTVSELVSSVDLLPTILEIIGVVAPANLQGESLYPLLSGDGGGAPRDRVFAEMTWHIHYDPMRMIRTSRYKYIRNFEERPRLVMPGDFSESPSSQSLGESIWAPRPAEELYDLEQDPWEQNNLSETPDMRTVKAFLREQLMNWLEKTGDPLLKGEVKGPDGLLNYLSENGIDAYPKPR